jgi:hypothetical protein
MPRLRCHWGILARVAAELQARGGEAGDLIRRHRGEYYAGGVAPDALRIFSGRDKPSTHFYDDQRPETWDSIPAAIAAAYPEIAEPASLRPATRAWMIGYLTHVLTDVAYWRNVLRHLPPFPEQAEAHLGAWLLADSQPIPSDERQVDLAAIDFTAAPSWIDPDAVRRMLDRLTGRVLVPDGMWPVELAYVRGRTESAGTSDADLLKEHLPAWENALARASDVLPAGVWDGFVDHAVQGALSAVETYLSRRESDSRVP